MTTDHLWQQINQNNAICPGADDEEEEPSDDIKDMSSQSSAEICTVKVINVHSIRFITVRTHLLPLGKALSVKCRAKGKY